MTCPTCGYQVYVNCDGLRCCMNIHCPKNHERSVKQIPKRFSWNSWKWIFGSSAVLCLLLTIL